jgi:hypothetical protein
MMDEPILTSYPHDKLSRLANEMTEVLPDNSGIRSIVFIQDEDEGAACEHTFGYPDKSVKGVGAMIFVDAATHIRALGKGIGIDVRLLINGEVWPPGE